MSSSDRQAELHRYVTTVAATGAATVLLNHALRDTGPSAGAPALVLGVVAVLAVVLPIRLSRREGMQAFTLEEGVLVALLLNVPLGIAPLVVVGASAVGHLLARKDLLKTSFNLGQVALWSTSATLVFGWVAGDAEMVVSARTVLAVLLATVVLNVVSLLLLAELFRRLSGRPYRSTIQESAGLNLVTWLGNTSFGLVLAFVVGEDPWVGLLAGSLMVGLYLGYRGYAGVLDERERAERLHDVTRALMDATGSTAATEVFLRKLRRLMSAEVAELVRHSPDGPEWFVLGADDVLHRDDGRRSLVEEAIRAGRALTVSAHAPGVGHVLRETGHRDGVAAPLAYEGRTLGGLAVYDRLGMEPWGETDATLLATLANEAAVALKNVELFAAVERERALLAEETRKLGDIVDNASDGIVMIEGDGRIAVWNDAMTTITGLDGAQVFGQPWFVVLRLRDRDGEELLVEGDNPLAAALRGERTTDAADVQVMRRDGQWRWLRVSVSPIERSGMGVLGAVLIARDVTREHEVEELKSDFVATVSHELRTPLTPLRGFLDTMIANDARLDADAREEIHQAMRGQVNRLERLVGDLLLVADVDRRTLGVRIEAVDLAGPVAEALARVQPPVPPDRVQTDLPTDATAVGDRAAVVRVLGALIDNAAKHTDGTIRVTVARHDDRMALVVADDGPGVPPWEHERIFRRFGRLGNHLHRTQGPGLGLPIARALAREMGGDVTVDSDVGRGSRFTLWLRAAVPRPVDEPITPRQAGSA